jgi:hypothetical protein
VVVSFIGGGNRSTQNIKEKRLKYKKKLKDEKRR